MGTNAKKAEKTEEMVKDWRFLIRAILDDKVSRAMCKMLILLTILLIFCNVILYLLAPHSPTAEILFNGINIMGESSFSERFGHGLSFVAAILFFGGYATYGARSLLLGSLLFAFIWFDDSIQYHEKMGTLIDQTVVLPDIRGLRPQDIGELIAWAGVGVFFAVFALWTWRRSQPGDRDVLISIAGIFALLAFCGVALDMLHIAIGPKLADIVGFFEDGGELFALCLAAAFAFGVMRVGGSFFQTPSGNAADRISSLDALK